MVCEVFAAFEMNRSGERDYHELAQPDSHWEITNYRHPSLGDCPLQVI